MVANSFKNQFIGPILAGTKDQTIRAPRLGASLRWRPPTHPVEMGAEIA